MAKIKNLLKESIVQAKKLKQSSALVTKDRLLSKISQDLKKRLTEDEENVEDDFIQEDEEIITDDLPVDDEISTEDEVVTEEDDFIPTEEDDDEDDEMLETDDVELDDIIEELQAENEEEQAYTQTALEQEDEEIPIEGQTEDEELMQKIRQILESQEDEDSEEVIEQFQENLRTECNKLRRENRQYKKHFEAIKQEMNETKCLNLKGNYALKIFEKFNLTKAQKMTVIENFDRARNERQIKLIFATLCEGLRGAGKKSTKKVSSPISNKIKSTKSLKENINKIDEEELAVASLFRRRAGI